MYAHLALVLGIGSSDFHLYDRCHVCVDLHLMFHLEHCQAISLELKAISSFSLRTVLALFGCIHREIDCVKIAHVTIFIGEPFPADTYLVLG
jgi:hypothetical protein